MSRPFRLAVVGLAFMSSFTGCATTAKPDTGLTPETTLVDERSYTLGERIECYVGEPLLSRRLLIETSTIIGTQADRDFEIMGGLGPAAVGLQGKAQDIFPVYGRIDGELAFEIPNHPHGYVFAINESGFFEGSIGGRTYGRSPLVTVNSYQIEPADTSFTMVTLSTASPLSDGSYINAEILYSGRTQDELRLTYREFTPSGAARPAFTQDLVFPIGADQIRVKAFQIAIMEARADGLVFAVTSD